MRKAFLMTSDAMLALIIVSASIVALNSLLSGNASYDNVYLHSITDDAAALIEYAQTEDIKTIIDAAPKEVCLKVSLQEYNGTELVKEKEYSKQGCPKVFKGEQVISKRTFFSESNYLIIVTGWYSIDK